MTARPETTIEVFADIACPFTHVGLTRFVQHRDRAGRSDVRLKVRAWPLELVNGAPLDPAAVAGKVADLRPLVDRRTFAGFDPQAFPASTLPALRLAAAGYRRSSDLGERVSLHLRALLFDHGVDISQDLALRAVADVFELQVSAADADTVLIDLEEGQRRGVIGSPHFFTPDGDWFCPSLDIVHEPDGRVAASFNTDRFEDFMATCLG